jgi:hypothetical protein
LLLPLLCCGALYEGAGLLLAAGRDDEPLLLLPPPPPPPPLLVDGLCWALAGIAKNAQTSAPKAVFKTFLYIAFMMKYCYLKIFGYRFWPVCNV